MMRIAVAVFACVAAIAAGLFWYQSQPVPPVQVAAPEAAKVEPAKPASPPQELTQKSETPALTPVPAPVELPAVQQTAKQPVSTLTTLAPAPLDPNNPEDVVMVSRPALVLRGQSSWDEGYQKLVDAFARLNTEAKGLNLPVTGRGVAVFVETDDQGFRFEAVLPVASLPPQRPAHWTGDLRSGATPEGKAIRFVHKGPYDEIDSTYEAITAYLDVKGIEAKETLIEEYINLGQESGDAEIEAYIYVQPNK